MNSEREYSQQSILEQAAEWYQRLSEAEVPEEAFMNWQSWLNQAEANMQAFEKVEELMQLSGQIEQISWPGEQELLTDEYDAEMPIANWRQLQHRQQHRQHKHRFSWRSLFTSNRQASWGLAGATLTIITMITLGIMLTWWKPIPPSAGNLNVALYETQAAEHRGITLPDGSRITLGAKSLLSVAYSAEQRRVILERGEAFFNVAKDPKWPFIVGSGNRTITAVGTAFNVTRHSDRVVVTVTEGSVIVAEETETTPLTLLTKAIKQKDDSPSIAVLKAGQQIAYSKYEVTTVTTADTEVVTAWRQGRLKYLGEKLRYVIADVNRYTYQPIRLGDERVADMLFTGTVFQDNIDTWLESIAEAFPVKVIKLPDGEILLLSRTDE